LWQFFPLLVIIGLSVDSVAPPPLQQSAASPTWQLTAANTLWAFSNFACKLLFVTAHKYSAALFNVVNAAYLDVTVSHPICHTCFTHNHDS
jgi:hypothetical protein